MSLVGSASGALGAIQQLPAPQESRKTAGSRPTRGTSLLERPRAEDPSSLLDLMLGDSCFSDSFFVALAQDDSFLFRLVQQALINTTCFLALASDGGARTAACLWLVLVFIVIGRVGE
jgi:hypothetical protein